MSYAEEDYGWGTEDDFEEEECGYTYDHKLQPIAHRDGWTTYMCVKCGAEIMEKDHQ